MRFIYTFLVLQFIIAPVLSISGSGQQKTGVELNISNIRNQTGLIRIGVFTSEEGYPDSPSMNYSLAKDTLNGGLLRLFVPLEETGSIAITVLDDENSNGKMDYIFGIKPREGFGFSNNPDVKSRKAPPFDTTLFNFTGGIQKIGITMKYI